MHKLAISDYGFIVSLCSRCFFDETSESVRTATPIKIMQNTRQAKKSQNILEIDTLDFIDKIEERLDKKYRERDDDIRDLIKDVRLAVERAEAKADAWREKRDKDLITIKNTVYEALERVEKKQAEIEKKQTIMDIQLSINTTDTSIIKNDLKKLEGQLKNITTIEVSTITKIVWGGLTALASAGLALAVTWLTKK